MPDKFGGVEVEEQTEKFGGVAIVESAANAGAALRSASPAPWSYTKDRSMEELMAMEPVATSVQPPAGAQLAPGWAPRIDASQMLVGPDGLKRESGMESGTELTTALGEAGMRVTAPVLEPVNKALSYAGNVVRAIPADIAESVAGNQKYYDMLNLGAAALGEPMPIDEQLKQASSESPGWAVTGKISQGIAGMIPTIVAFWGLPSAAQKVALAGFTIKQLDDFRNDSAQLGDELGKPKDQQNPDKITSLVSNLAQTGLFAGAGIYGGRKMIAPNIKSTGTRIGMEAPELTGTEALPRPGPDVPEQLRAGPLRWAAEPLPLSSGAVVAPSTAQLPPPAQRDLTAQQYFDQANLTPPADRGAPAPSTAQMPISAPQEISGMGRELLAGRRMVATPEQAGQIREFTPRSPSSAPPAAGAPIPTAEAPKPPTAPAAPTTPVTKLTSDQFISALNDPANKLGNGLTKAAGLGAESVADLEKFAEMRDASSAEQKRMLDEIRAMPNGPDKLVALNKVPRVGQRAQLSREAIETATNTGSWVEEESATKLGARPLDWRKSPEVADWLRKNGERLGIVLPDELKAPKPPTPTAPTAEPTPPPAATTSPLKAGDVVDHQGQPKTIKRMSPDGKFAVIGNRAVPVSEIKAIEKPAAAPVAPGKRTYSGAKYQSDAKEFEKLVQEYGMMPEHGWIRNPDFVAPKEGTWKDISSNSELTRAYLKVLDQLGLKTDRATLKAKAQALPALKALLELHAKTVETPLENLPDGTAFTVAGEPHKILGTTPEGVVTIERVDGSTFKKNMGEAIKIDPGSGPAATSTDFLPPEAQGPKLAPGAKQGDLVDSTQRDTLSLAGEVTGDAARIAEKQAADAKLKAEAAAIQAKQQQDLFNKPSAPGKGPASDWTSATEEPTSAGLVNPPETGLEAAAGIPLPKFANRKMSPLDRVTASHSGKLQKSFDEARRAQREIKTAVPSERRQNAISIWREAKGDVGTLKGWASAAKGKMFRQAAIDAQTLTPKEIAIATKAGAAFDALHARGTAFDVLSSHRDAYVPHVWDVARPGTGFGTGMLKQRFRFSKARTFDTFFDGDQAGFKPKTLAIGKLLPAYIHEMNKVIADRQAVRDIVAGTNKDGSPMAVPRGNSKVVDGDSGQAVLVQPRAMKDVDTSDYRVMSDQPALSNWTWASKDTAGKPVFIKSDLALHPDAYRRINAMLGQSAIRQWYRDPVTGTAQIPRAVVRGLDTAQSAMKREMFGLLAPFHQVQEGTHGIGHMVNPFSHIPKVDLRDPVQLDAANHGLMMLPDRASARVYLEGVGTKSSLLSQGIRKAGPVGRAVSDVIDGYQDYLFHQYIPGLKFKTYQAMLGRNIKLYAEELKSGEMTPSDVKITSAEQANAAYGHLNYALLDRNPTIQHLIQLSALAPDFLEARGRFTAQAVKGLTSKVGHEQFKAIAILAAVQAASAYIISNVTGGEYDPHHPFEVIHNGRRYAMRSVPEDIFSLLKDTRQFAYSRVNPLTVKGGIQLATGLNSRGEKVTPLDTFEELLAGYIPLTARQLPGLRSLTETSRQNPVSPLQQLAGSLGLRISRYSPVSETYKLAGAWMDAQKMDRSKGSYPISKYQQLRYALEDGDLDRAKTEYDALLTTATPEKIKTGFKSSITHPFTGKKSTDEAFAASLSGYEKQLYLQALRTRTSILQSFDRLPTYRAPAAAPPPYSETSPL